GEQPLAPPPLTAPARRGPAMAKLRQQPLHLRPHIRRGHSPHGVPHPPPVPPPHPTHPFPHPQQREPLVQRQATPPPPQPALGCGPPHALPGKPRLADASVPDHEHQPRVPAQRHPQAGQLTLTADKPHRPGHTPSPPARICPVNPFPATGSPPP